VPSASGGAGSLRPFLPVFGELVQQGLEAGVVPDELEVGVLARPVRSLLFFLQGGSEQREGGVGAPADRLEAGAGVFVLPLDKIAGEFARFGALGFFPKLAV